MTPDINLASDLKFNLRSKIWPLFVKLCLKLKNQNLNIFYFWNDSIAILSTPLGYMWMFMLFTFRMFITAVVGGPVYGDESGNFKCDTNQPGCQNVCFNRFSPISHLRFWAFQMLFVCLPSVAFMTYAQFELQKIDVITKKEKEFIENAGVSFRQIFILLHEFKLNSYFPIF